MEKIHQSYFSVYKKESSLLLKASKLYTPTTKKGMKQHDAT